MDSALTKLQPIYEIIIYEIRLNTQLVLFFTFCATGYFGFI